MKKKVGQTPQEALEALLKFIADSGNLIGDASSERTTALDLKWQDVMRAWLDAGCPGFDPHPKQAPVGKIRVRIAVAQRGKDWNAHGWGGPDDGAEHVEKMILGVVWDGLDTTETGNERLDWIEADVPAVVEPTTVEGVVRP